MPETSAWRVPRFVNTVAVFPLIVWIGPVSVPKVVLIVATLPERPVPTLVLMPVTVVPMLERLVVRVPTLVLIVASVPFTLVNVAFIAFTLV